MAQIDFYFKCIFASQKQLVPVALRKPKCFAGNTPDRSGVIVPGTAMEEAPDTPPEKKPKRSGKPKPLEDRINFQVYFQRWLGRQDQLSGVLPALVSREGYHLQVLDFPAQKTTYLGVPRQTDSEGSGIFYYPCNGSLNVGFLEVFQSRPHHPCQYLHLITRIFQSFFWQTHHIFR